MSKKRKRQRRYKGGIISAIHTKQGLRFSVSHTVLAPLFRDVSRAEAWISSRRRRQRLGLLESIYRPNRVISVPYTQHRRRTHVKRKSAQTRHAELRKKRLTYRKGMHKR